MIIWNFGFSGEHARRGRGSRAVSFVRIFFDYYFRIDSGPLDAIETSATSASSPVDAAARSMVSIVHQRSHHRVGGHQRRTASTPTAPPTVIINGRRFVLILLVLCLVMWMWLFYFFVVIGGGDDQQQLQQQSVDSVGSTIATTTSSSIRVKPFSDLRNFFSMVSLLSV